MDKIFNAITSNDEDKVINLIPELEDLSRETLRAILEKCTSQKIEFAVKKEFLRQLNVRNLVIPEELADEFSNISSENVRNNREEYSEDESIYDENLDISDAMKKYTLNNSKQDKALEMFLNAFKHNIENINYDKAGKISKSIVENLSKEFSQSFPKEVRSKTHNLKENKKLCEDVYRCVIGINSFVKMLPSEMQSEELKNKDNEYIKERLLASQMAKVSADTNMFQCSKCKQNKCTYSQLQTRSCDEPMTTFVTCTVCGHRWKF